jgi:hypothetical protein
MSRHPLLLCCLSLRYSALQAGGQLMLVSESNEIESGEETYPTYYAR